MAARRYSDGRGNRAPSLTPAPGDDLLAPRGHADSASRGLKGLSLVRVSLKGLQNEPLPAGRVILSPAPTEPCSELQNRPGTVLGSPVNSLCGNLRGAGVLGPERPGLRLGPGAQGSPANPPMAESNDMGLNGTVRLRTIFSQ